MAVVTTAVMNKFVADEQSLAKQLVAIAAAMDDLTARYNADGVSTNVTDAFLATVPAYQHLLAADCVTFESNLQAVRTAISAAIIGNAEHMIG